MEDTRELNSNIKLQKAISYLLNFKISLRVKICMKRWVANMIQQYHRFTNRGMLIEIRKVR